MALTKDKIYYEALGLKPTRSALGINFYDYDAKQIDKAYKKVCCEMASG